MALFLKFYNIKRQNRSSVVYWKSVMKPFGIQITFQFEVRIISDEDEDEPGGGCIEELWVWLKLWEQWPVPAILTLTLIVSDGLTWRRAASQD